MMLFYYTRKCLHYHVLDLRLKMYCSILSTPLMALKKRGFNVDRILNQQREERLRIQAESVRDKEKAAVESAARPPPPYTSFDRDDKSVTSVDSKTPIDEESSFMGTKTRSLFDKLKRGNRDSKPLLPPPAGGLDGAVGGRPQLQLPGLGESSKSGGMGMRGGSGLGGVGGGGGENTTKRVSRFLKMEFLLIYVLSLPISIAYVSLR
jgi:hypothetical protein